MRSDAKVAFRQPPVRGGHEGEHGVDVGIAHPGALLASRAVQEGIGRADIQRPGTHSPDGVETLVVAIEGCLAASWITVLDRAHLQHPGLAARDGRQVTEPDGLVGLNSLWALASQPVPKRPGPRPDLDCPVLGQIFPCVEVDDAARTAFSYGPGRRQRDTTRVPYGRCG